MPSGHIADWHVRGQKGRVDALSDMRDAYAVETGSVGQWVTGWGSTTDFAELSLHHNVVFTLTD